MTGESFIAFLLMVFLLGCKEEKIEDPYVWLPMEVTATAYNSVESQTNDQPTITAWGDTLAPESNSLAVSRDLIGKGLTYGTMVRIENFPDTFLINDKMHQRWRNRIDIHMGKDRKRALEWGRKKIKIYYAVLRDSLDAAPMGTSEIKEQ